MEILDYLRIAKRRWWILVLVPVLAAAAAAAVILLQPTSYTTTATISSGSFVGNEGSPFTGPQGVQQYVAAFNAAAANPQLRAEVKSATGVDSSAQAADLIIKPLGDSADVQVSYTANSAKTATGVVTETARRALENVFSSRSKQAQATRDQALKSSKEANAAIAALASKYKIADPPRAYQAQLSQVGSLEQQQATLRAGGNAIGAAALDAPITAARQVLGSYLPILAEYNNLASAQQATSADLTTAQAQYRQAASLESASTSDGVIYVGPALAQSKVSALVATVIPVFAAGIFLGVILVILLEVVARLRRAAAEDDLVEGEGSPVVTRASRRAGQTSDGSTDGPAGGSTDPAPVEPSYR